MMTLLFNNDINYVINKKTVSLNLFFIEVKLLKIPRDIKVAVILFNELWRSYKRVFLYLFKLLIGIDNLFNMFWQQYILPGFLFVFAAGINKENIFFLSLPY